jgi:hypothetical protein
VTISLAFACPAPACGKPVEATLSPGTTEASCPACGTTTPLPEAAAIAESGQVDACPVCGGVDLYSQRDFNRPLGLLLAAIGLATGPFTHWISTVALIGLDAVLYALVPQVAICYACNAQQRGYDPAKGPPAFDIAVHDAYKFAKRFPPRRERAVAGPLARRLQDEGKAPRPP